MTTHAHDACIQWTRGHVTPDTPRTCHTCATIDTCAHARARNVTRTRTVIPDYVRVIRDDARANAQRARAHAPTANVCAVCTHRALCGHWAPDTHPVRTCTRAGAYTRTLRVPVKRWAPLGTHLTCTVGVACDVCPHRHGCTARAWECDVQRDGCTDCPSRAPTMVHPCVGYRHITNVDGYGRVCTSRVK